MLLVKLLAAQTVLWGGWALYTWCRLGGGCDWLR